MGQMIIDLTAEEVSRARAAAAGRTTRARGDGCVGHNAQSPEDKPRHDFIGCLGELAVAKALGVPWTSEFTHRADDDDVAGYEVRTGDATRGQRRRLWLYDSDDAEQVFVSAAVLHIEGESARRAYGGPPITGTLVRVQGWTRCKNGRVVAEPSGRAGREGAVYVPNDMLASLSTLPAARRA